MSPTVEEREQVIRDISTVEEAAGRVFDIAAKQEHGRESTWMYVAVKASTLVSMSKDLTALAEKAVAE